MNSSSSWAAAAAAALVEDTPVILEVFLPPREAFKEGFSSAAGVDTGFKPGFSVGPEGFAALDAAAFGFASAGFFGSIEAGAGLGLFVSFLISAGFLMSTGF